MMKQLQTASEMAEGSKGPGGGGGGGGGSEKEVIVPTIPA